MIKELMTITKDDRNVSLCVLNGQIIKFKWGN
jgi:hypothetical protein